MSISKLMKKTSKTIPFTTEKYKEMQIKVAELEKLREEVMGRLVIARGMGDLSENGAYKYAKFELGNIGRQLKRFKGLLREGFPAPKNTGPKGTIDFGSEVSLEKCVVDQEPDSKMDSQMVAPKIKTFMIVSEHESDPSEGKLAYSSPMGKAVMRKKVGDKVNVETPKGMSEWLIVGIN
jgi:transcription elongation factor GreA